MKLWLTLTTALMLCACGTMRPAPRFTQPSTAPIKQSTQSARQHVQQAQKQVQVIEKTVERDCPELKLQITDLSNQLGSALSDLSTLDGERTQLEGQLKIQTDDANRLSDQYNKILPKVTSLESSRHRWVSYFWYAAGLLALSVVWILRKPIFLLIGGAGL